MWYDAHMNTYSNLAPRNRSGCTITQTHCESCGNTNREDVDAFNPDLEGYSGCCNELITSQADCRNHHGRG